MAIRTVGVLGCRLMGSGIAQVEPVGPATAHGTHRQGRGAPRHARGDALRTGPARNPGSARSNMLTMPLVVPCSGPRTPD